MDRFHRSSSDTAVGRGRAFLVSLHVTTRSKRVGNTIHSGRGASQRVPILPETLVLEPLIRELAKRHDRRTLLGPFSEVWLEVEGSLGEGAGAAGLDDSR